MRSHPTLSLLIAQIVVCMILSGLPAGPAAPAAAQAPSLPESYSRVATWVARPQPRPAGEITEVAGIDVGTDGTVYVVDKAEGAVHVLSASGRGLRLVGGPGAELGQLDLPTDVAVAGDRLYVTDTGNRRVQVFDAPSGRFLAEWRGLGRPWGIAVGADRVYVSDAEAPRITVLDRAGVVQSTWGQGAGARVAVPLFTPRGLAVDAEGDVYVADPGRANGPILELTGQGGFKRTLEAPSGGSNNRPMDIAVDGDTPFTVSPDEVATYRRFLVTTNPARFATIVGGRGIAIGPGGGLVVSVQDGRAVASGVRFFESRSNGRSSSFWGSLPAAVGALAGPRRIAATEDGGAYLVDAWPRIQRWGPTGVPAAQFRAEGAVDIARAPDGGVYRVDGAGVARLAPDGRAMWIWEEGRTGARFTAGAVSAGRLVVADAGRGRMLRFDPAGGGAGPEAEAPLTGGLVVDLAADGDRLLAVDRAAQALRLVDLAGTELARWPFPGRVTRVAAAGGGAGWFVLTADGWVWKYAPDGTLRAAWDGAPEGAPIDLDVNSAGAVLVADGRGHRVFVYAPSQQSSPDIPPKPGERCDLSPEKTAAPARVAVGDPVTVTLELAGDCPSEPVDLDVVLVIDQSGSMEGPKIEAARSSGVAFTAELDFRKVRAGVVLFSSSATLRQELTNNPEAVVRAVAGALPSGATNIGDGLAVARSELAGPRARAGAQKAIVLMTDGLPGDPDAARREAEQARVDGITVYTIGLGGDVDGRLLAELAGAPERYFQAPTEAELSAVYGRIARRLVTGTLLRRIDVVDQIPSNMTYVAGSARPAAVWDGRALRWALTDVTPAGFRFTYQVQPQVSGIWPTNVRADGDYTDGVGYGGRVTFPVPKVEVTGNRVAYLPIAFQRACPDLRSDIVLVIDTSTSMDAAAVPGGETKLDAARQAARAFLGFLALPADRAAVVGFNDRAGVVQSLTGDRAALAAALDRLPRASGTRIDLGLAAALAELTGPNRNPRNLPIVVLLTDGRPSAGTEAGVRAEVRALRAAGAYTFAIGLGEDADGGLLVEIAGSSARYAYAPDQSALASIYQTIAWSLPCGE